MSSLGLGLLGGALALGGERLNKRPLIRTKPHADSAVHKKAELVQSLDDYVNKVAPENPLTAFHLKNATSNDIIEASKPRGDMKLVASSGVEDGIPNVKMNMNAPAPMFAHELGHVAFGQTGIGRAVQDARAALKDNPNLKKALLTAASLTPLGVAALTPGDEDMLASIALSLGIEAPTLVDEFEANRRSVPILEGAGVPVTRGDRARMAGAFLSYLGKPLVIAASGNALGNMIDEDVPVVM